MDLMSLKSRLSLALVMPRYDMAPDRNGMLCCPFHDDKSPSMQVTGESLYCHSANCAHHGRHIDVIDPVKLKEDFVISLATSTGLSPGGMLLTPCAPPSSSSA